MDDKLTEHLAEFFIAAWDVYCDNPTVEWEWILQETDLIESHEATQEDIDTERAPDGHEVGDTYYILSPLGHAAWEVMTKASNKRRAELGVAVTSQSTTRDDADV